MGDPRVASRHLVFITSNYATKICTLCFPTFCITLSFRDILDSCNCVDPYGQIVSYLLTLFLRSWNQTHCISRIPLGWHEKCRGVLMVGSRPSSTIISPQRPACGALLSTLNGCLQVLLRLYSTTVSRLIDHMYVPTELRRNTLLE